MPGRGRFTRLTAKVGKALRSLSPLPPDNDSTKPKHASTPEGNENREAHEQSTALQSADVLSVGRNTPQRSQGDGLSAQSDSVTINVEDRSLEDAHLTPGDGQPAGAINTSTAQAHSAQEPLPTTASDAKKTGVAALKWVLEMTREIAEVSDVLGPLKAATGGLLNAWDRFEASNDVKEDFERAANKMEVVNSILKKHGAGSDMQDYVQWLADNIASIERSIPRQDDRSRGRRMVDARDDARDAAVAIRALGDVADLFVMNATASMADKLDTLLENQLLERFHYVSKAVFKAIPSSGCLEGTCVQLLEELHYWATTEEDVPPVCFLSGPAGFGKTTVAYTMCKVLDADGLLGGSFFCSRDAGVDRRSLRAIFPTLARSLTLVSRPYAEFLAKKLQSQPGASDFELSRQFDVLLSGPRNPNRSSKSDGSTPQSGFKVFVIDALDECDDEDEATYNMLQILKDKVRGRHLRFLIVSRPEPRILQAFSTPNSGWSSIVRFQDVPGDVVMNDVSKYLRQELNRCAKRRSLSNWPSDNDFHQLELRASGLFIYAATACKFIAAFGGDPRKRLSEVVEVGSSGIDPMYGFVLSTALAGQTTEEKSITVRFLQAVICLLEPLPLQALAQLLQIDEETLCMTVSVLHSVVYVPERGSAAPVTTFHASFADYLLSTERSSGQPWHVDAESVHRDLFASCVHTMKQGLHFNVSQTRTSYARNENQPDRRPIADVLRYACLKWMDHLEDAGASLSDAEQLDSVFPGAFLFWLEVLSVVDGTESGLDMMSRLSNWLGKRLLRHRTLTVQDMVTVETATFQRKEAPLGSDGVQGRWDSKQMGLNGLMMVARHAVGFMAAFAEPIRASAAHIYLSALMHDNSPYGIVIPNRASYRNVPRVITGQRRVLPVFVMAGHKGRVNSIAISPDGTQIVSGSDDQTIRLWDAETGAAIGDPLRGHENWVCSVAFSPDGTRIASGSYDATIRLWDAETGAAIGDPLRGHKDWVRSVAFSPDGTRIASGSHDQTIRMWDTEAGASIGDPLRGHKEQVRSVAFSPNGTRIVSGSDDKTIRVWDVETRTAIGDPLRGHQQSVLSVAFSPDGTRIASGSCDRTIRLWDAETGAAICDPLRGHDYWVTSVAFSPDGTRIVSGSDDKTIRLWSTFTGAAIDPIRGHEGLVWSVAFSPDGTRIASGSHDKTIRMWDAETGAAIGGPLRGHKDWVSSVAFSPDGTRIASGSADNTVRLWDAETGAAIDDPLRGHENRVKSVAFSPDGTRIASGSEDETIRLWDAETGAAIGDPLRGHKDWANSVAFSPDGEPIASGSDDKTIRVWDTKSAAAIDGSLQCHKAEVRSVALSQGGTRIASASYDETIRLWNAKTGAAIGGSFEGHKDWVFSVAFSPDGARIVSGARDETIRLWDAETGAAIGDALLGHEDWVRSVAFSPNGTRIVSGSRDKAIRVWDTETGVPIGDPLRGHEDSVLSVTFSPDGTRIASSSDDQVIRLWHAENGASIGNPIGGHGDSVWSVAFSPDGTQIVSGSADNTVRLWDAETGTAIGNPLRGHQDWVLSVAFSPDGTRIASGSKDKEIRLWDAKTGAAIGDPLRGHQDWVASVAFSPDMTHIASGSWDMTIRLWYAEPCASIGNLLRGHEKSTSPVAFSPHETHSVSCFNDNTPGLHDQDVNVATARYVAFSPDRSHSARVDALLQTEPSSCVAFSLSDDGWLCGPQEQLFLWLPPEYHRGLCWPRMRAIMGVHPVALDLSRFVHGEEWIKCYTSNVKDDTDDETFIL